MAPTGSARAEYYSTREYIDTDAVIVVVNGRMVDALSEEMTGARYDPDVESYARAQGWLREMADHWWT